MIGFQASIIDPNTGSTGVLAANNCTQVTLEDSSNYAQNNEPGHTLANFANYRTWSLTYYNGTNYPLSSVTAPPTCSPAYGGTNPTINLTTGDGWYKIVLNTVPTWNSGSIGYLANTQQVWNPSDGNIYTCAANNISSAANRPDLSPANWTLVLPANIPTSLLSKYTAVGYFALTCNSAICLPKLVSDALCNGTTCDMNFTTNPALIKAAIGFLALYSIQCANQVSQVQFTSSTFDVLNSLCGCD